MQNRIKAILIPFYLIISITIEAQQQRAIDPSIYIDQLHKKNNINVESPPPGVNSLKKAGGWNFRMGDKKNLWTADLSTGQYYQVETTCRGIGNYCYVFVEDAVWGIRVDQASIENIIATFEKSTPANSNKGIYQTNVEAFGSPPDVDNDPKIIICILDIRDNYSPGNAYIAGYYDSANQFNYSTSNNCEMYYMDCDPAILTNQNSFRTICSTMAHEFQHMIMFNYHGIINQGRQQTFFNEGSSLAAEVINGYPVYEQNSLFNLNSNRSLLLWNPNNNLNDVLFDYSRAARFFLYLKEQFGISLFKHFVQAPVTGIDAFDQYALPAIATNRRFNDIVEDWYIANYLNDRSINSRWGYNSDNSFSNVSSSIIQFDPNIQTAAGSVYKLAAQYITYTQANNFNITFSNTANPSIRIKVIKKGKAGKEVNDVALNGPVSFPDFGEDYSSLTFVVYHNNGSENSSGPFTYNYSSSGTLISAGTFSKISNMTINRQNFGLTVLNNFEVLLSGGVEMKGSPPNMTSQYTYTGELFNQETNTFSSLAGQMITTHGTQATKLFNGKVYLIGGQRKEELYDPVKRTFEELPQPNSRNLNIGSDALLLPDGDVLILGSKSYFVSGNPTDDSLRLVNNYIYSTANNSLELTGDFITGGSGFSSVLLPNGEVLITGGQIDTWYFNGSYWLTRTVWLDDAEIYNPEKKEFRSAGKMNSKRSSHTSSLLPNGKVLITGGYYGNTLTRIAEIYDPETNTFTRTGDINTGRYGHESVLLPSGGIMIIGGDRGNGNPTNINEIFDPAANTFTISSSLSEQRAFPQAVTLPNGNVLVASGYTDRNSSTVQYAELFIPNNFLLGKPGQPNLNLPIDNAAGQENNLLFTWNICPGAVYYRLQISRSEDFSQVVLDTTEIPIIGIKIKNLPSGERLFWRVKSINSNGESNWSPLRSVLIKDVIPQIVTLSYPKNNSTKNKTGIELSWGLQINSTYHLQVSTDISFSSLIINDSSLTKSVYNGLFSEGTKYFWRVRGWSRAGYGIWSSIWNFTTDLNAPSNLLLQRSGIRELKLTWLNNSSNCEGFIIERKTGNSSSFQIIAGSVNAATLIYYDNNVEQGNSYTYRIKAYRLSVESDYCKEESILLVGVENKNIPLEYCLFQNYPNPFNPSTTLKFELPAESRIVITIYNLLGEKTAELIDEIKPPGYYSIFWNADNFSSGIYFYQIKAVPTNGEKLFQQTRKMILIR
ncbi:MAG TPA: kelch repeat-containing protein [Melioribacteraceae bacterium]|nr:kelch repeat-containing protein [Melioribacteraceae bacterium]